MKFTFDEYQEQTKQTRIYRDKIREILETIGITDPAQADPVAKLLSVAYGALGMGESGEVQGKIKKVIRDSGGIITKEVRAQIAEELGDCLWYLAAVAEEFDLDLGWVARNNLNKLAGRFERGTIQGSGDNR